MTAFFRGIKYFFEEIAFAPYDYLRNLELSSWWGANTPTWIMIVILSCLLFYWVAHRVAFSLKQIGVFFGISLVFRWL